MRFLVIWLLVLSTLMAEDIKVELSGDLEASLIKFENKHATIYEANLYSDFYYNDYKLGTSIGMYKTNRPFFNTNIKQYSPQVNMYRFNEFYLTRKLNENFDISIGLFPFKKGRFYEHSFNGNKRGIGIYTLTDLPMQGGIVTYNNGKHKVQIGNVGYERWFKSYHDEIEQTNMSNYRTFNGSRMDFISYEWQCEKWYTKLLYTDIEQKIMGNVVNETNGFTFALEYDDQIDTGRTYYGIVSFTKTDGDNRKLSPAGGSYENDIMYFGKYKTNGNFLLLGVKQELDSIIFNRDVAVGFEYMRRSYGHHTLLAGKPISYESSGDVGEVYNTFVGLRVDKSKLLKLRYYHYDSGGKMTKAPHTPIVNGVPNGLESLGSYDAFVLQLYIEF